jgi:glycosyltransferase involved in cell wall biosynthesis
MNSICGLKNSSASYYPVFFSIITPSYKQLDWLRLCVASVRDQVALNAEGGNLKAETTPVDVASHFTAQQNQGPRTRNQEPGPKNPPSPLAVEHIIQDAGSPGIEEFAREIGADFYRDGELQFAAVPRDELSVASDQSESPLTRYALPATRNYRVAVYCERDAGMYDAINRGLSRTSGKICAWLNSDEQYLPGTLNFVFNYFQQNPETDVLLGDALLTDAESQPLSYRRIMVPSMWHTRLDHLHSLSCSMFFKRTTLPSPPLDTRWRIIGDAILVDYFLQKRFRIVACKKLLSAYAFTGVNLSADRPGSEISQWWDELRWPPKYFRLPCVLWHRFRRFFAGAYWKKNVKTALFTRKNPDHRVPIASMVGGLWRTR